MRRSLCAAMPALALALFACGPSSGDGGDGGGGRDGGDPPMVPDACRPGAVEPCYHGPSGTQDVGPCRAGQRTCGDDGRWGACTGQVVPAAEICGNGVDDNCSGEVDEDIDLDHDGFSTCGGDCCDALAACSAPVLVNPGAFDAPGNGIDDDCDGQVDNTIALCDSGLRSSSADAMDYAKAIELCQIATEQDRRWGVISAKLTLVDGTGAPAAPSRSIRPGFGTGVTPRGGASFIELSTGHAADTNDQDPAYMGFDLGAAMDTFSGYPADWLMRNNGRLPNAPNCPGPDGNQANDPVMLTLRIRVPTNAKSFQLSSNFFSAEYPEYVCSSYNDFYVVLLDSTWTGSPANPADKNLATYAAADGTVYPVGVNLVHGNTGLFRQCRNGRTGCTLGSRRGDSTTCTAESELAGTGFDEATPGLCNLNSLSGGGTGWLVTTGNVVGGEVITLRVAIWDTSDENLDSLVIVDNFQWSVTAAQPGTDVP